MKMINLKALRIQLKDDGSYLIISKETIDENWKFEEKIEHSKYEISGEKGEESEVIWIENGRICLKEREIYKYKHSDNWKLKFNPQLKVEEISSTIGTFQYLDYVGFSELIEGLTVKVYTKKLDEENYNIMLNEIAEILSGLLFDFLTPTTLPTKRREIEKERIYGDYLFLKYIMDENMFPAYFELIKSNPHREIIFRDEYADISQAYEITPKTVMDISTKSDNLIESKTGLFLEEKLKGRLPEKILQTRKISTFDTIENRFVKYFFYQLLFRIDEIKRTLKKREGDAIREMINECSQWINALEEYSKSYFLENVSTIHTIPSNSQVLLKREGYREIFQLYLIFLLSGVLEWEELEEIIMEDNKKIWLLYEYWVLFKILDFFHKKGVLLEKGLRNLIKDKENSIRIELKKGKDTKISTKIGNIYYNRTFKKDSYSVNLTPDMVIETEERKIILDAKYRYDKSPFSQYKEEDETTIEKIVVNSDIYKMHAYKDAIRGCDIAIAVFPGDKSIFYDEERDEITSIEKMDQNFKGVGAISLIPSRDKDLDNDLFKFLDSLLINYRRNNNK